MKQPFYIYFVPKTHHDLGYTQPIDELLQTYCQYYDRVLEFCARTENYPDEAKYRYTVESFWSLEYYLRHTSQINRNRMKHYVQTGRIEIQAFYANIIDGLCSEEEIARLMYPSEAYARECGVKLTSAAITDIPGMSAGLIKALSDAQIPYLFVGFPMYFSWHDCTGQPVKTPNSFWAEKELFPWSYPAAFNWEAISGEKVFSWYQFGYGWMFRDSTGTSGNLGELVFDPETYEEMEVEVPRLIAELKDRGVPYQIMRYIDHGSDNVSPSDALCDVIKQWNEEHDDVKCIVATETMFFDALQEECRRVGVMNVKGELPHTDYTTCSLSDAQMTTLNARTKIRASQLETVNTMALLSGKGLDIRKQMKEIYDDILLCDEHCYGMDVFNHRYDYNRSLKWNYAVRAAQKESDLRRRVMSAAVSKEEGCTIFKSAGVTGDCVAMQICRKKKDEAKSTFDRMVGKEGSIVYVQRDRIEDICLPINYLADEYAWKLPEEELIQETYAISSKENLAFTEMRSMEPCTKTEEIKRSDTVLENRYYRLEFDADSGTLRRIFDKELETYVTDPEFAVGAVLVRNIETDELVEAKTQKMYHRMAGPVADSMVSYQTVYSLPLIVMEVVLYHQTKRIDFSYRFVMDRIPLREVFINFPFCVQDPTFTFQGIGTPVKAFDDIVVGANTNQYACQNWCKAEGSNGTCLLALKEARVIEVGGIHPTAVSQAHRHLTPKGIEIPYVSKKDMKKAHIASMVLYNNSQTNFAMMQQGEVLYHYSITSGRNIKADCFARNFAFDGIVEIGTFPATAITLTNKDLCIISFKQAEDGNGFILRIRETNGVTTKFGIKIQGVEITSAEKSTVTETALSPIDPDQIQIAPYEIITARIRVRERR